MRLPGRFLVFTCGFLAAVAGIAQAPPPPPPPREVPGGTLVVAPRTETVTQSEAAGVQDEEGPARPRPRPSEIRRRRRENDRGDAWRLLKKFGEARLLP